MYSRLTAMVCLGMALMHGSLAGGLRVLQASWELRYTLTHVMGVDISFVLDFSWETELFLSVLWYIYGSVSFYGMGYMEGNVRSRRFFIVVFLFVLSMEVFIRGGNLFTVFLGWEGLGLSSFYLIQHYPNQEAYEAAILTACVMRWGDAFLMLGLAWWLSGDGTSALLAGVVWMAASTKSAQFPFSSWLPAAMMAPTPVSSLVHSSTLVTAGVYLLYRFQELWVSSVFSEAMLIFGVWTAVLGAAAGCFMSDVKKLVALSTLVNLGYMMVGLGMEEASLSLFHCFVHALGKANMFIAMGVLLSSRLGCQDVRSLNIRSSEHSPLAWCVLYISMLSMAGLPFFSVAISKEALLVAYIEGSFGLVLWLALVLSLVGVWVYTMGFWVSVAQSKAATWVEGWRVNARLDDQVALGISMLLSSVAGVSFKYIFFWNSLCNPVFSSTGWLAVFPPVLAFFWVFVSGNGLLDKFEFKKRFFIPHSLFLLEPSHQIISKFMWVVTRDIKCYGEALCEIPAREIWNILQLRHLEHRARQFAVPPMMLGSSAVSLGIFCIIIWVNLLHMWD